MGTRQGLEPPPLLAPSRVTAKAMGFIWENFSRQGSGGASQLVSGTAYYSLFPQMPGTTLTGLAFDVTLAGASQTLTRAAVIDAVSGAIISQSANVSTTFQSTGLKVVSLGTPVTVAVDTAYYAVLIGVGGTQPFLTRGNASTDAQQYQTNAFAFGRRAGLTDITAAVPNSASGPGFWVAGVGTWSA